jgi:hypothetical protein
MLSGEYDVSFLLQAAGLPTRISDVSAAPLDSAEPGVAK